MEKQTRKKYAKHGECKSKMISFRCDEKALEVLSKQENKGRFINNAILWYYSVKNDLFTTN